MDLLAVNIFLLLLLGLFSFALFILYSVLTRSKKISASGALANTFLGIIRIRRFLGWAFRNPMRSQLKASGWLSSKHFVSVHHGGVAETLTVQPWDYERNLHIVYFHGGGYVIGKSGVGQSESLVSRLVDACGGRLSFVDYPVAPESGYRETLDGVYEAYQRLCLMYPDDVFVLMGDSAGGGLALSFAQMIRGDPDVVQPVKVVGFSPWLDLTLENPDIARLEPLDMILSVDALRYAAVVYAGDDTRNPLVSPIFGDFTGLDVLLFFGTRELFYADGLRLQELALENGWSIGFRFYEGMPHDWVLMPIEESRQAISEVCEFIDSNLLSG